MRYPTQKQILAQKPVFKPKTIDIVKLWKKNIWKKARKGNDKEKYAAITILLNSLANLHNKKIIIKNGHRYLQYKDTVVFGKKPSIISALHEFGHLICGPSELKACRYSIHLFKETFPQAFKKLVWKKHTLTINNKTM